MIGTAVPPLAARVAAPVVAAVAAAPRVNAPANAAEITQEMVGQDHKWIEDFDAVAAQANSSLLQTLKPRDVMATMVLHTPSAKLEKRAKDYAALLASRAPLARS